MARGAPGLWIDPRRTLACQYGSRDELAIMLDRHSVPMETSCPDAVIRPTWQARQRSEVWNVRSRFPVADLLAARIGAQARRIATMHRIFISTPRIIHRRLDPTGNTP